MADSQFKSKMAMSLASASRFAVLKIEDDEEEREVAKNKQSKAKQEEFQVVAKKKPKKKKPDDKDTVELQSLAFSSNKAVKKKPPKSTLNNTKKPVSEGQWQEWIKKDSEFVTDSYEQDLQQAILLSKLDYEEKKEVYDCVRPDDAKGGKNGKKNSKKKDKPSTLSLDQFNNMAADQLGNASKENKIGSSNSDSHLTTVKPTADDEHFFEKVASDAEKILHREQRFEAFKQLEPNITPSARTLQFQDEIEKRDREIEQLKTEVETLKTELLTVKTRNKKLCNILAQGEMREKAEILVQVDQLTKIKDELTEQVTELHGSLEQERSKVHALQMDSKKYQGNRKESK